MSSRIFKKCKNFSQFKAKEKQYIENIEWNHTGNPIEFNSSERKESFSSG